VAANLRAVHLGSISQSESSYSDSASKEANHPKRQPRKLRSANAVDHVRANLPSTTPRFRAIEVISSADSFYRTGCYLLRDSEPQWPSEVGVLDSPGRRVFITRTSNMAIATSTCLANVNRCSSQAYDCRYPLPNRRCRFHDQLSPRCERCPDSISHRCRQCPPRGSPAQRNCS